MDFIKEELSSEEKMFEKAVVTERFLKKYKKSIIALLSLVVIIALGNMAYKAKERSRIEEANKQLALLTENPSDKQAEEKLKELSPKLYAAWSFSHAVNTNDTKKLQQLQNSDFFVINDLSAYEAAARTADLKSLDAYSLRQQAIYKDLALVDEAVIHMNRNEIAQSKEKLAMIGENSPLKGVASILNHYGVK